MCITINAMTSYPFSSSHTSIHDVSNPPLYARTTVSMLLNVKSFLKCFILPELASEKIKLWRYFMLSVALRTSLIITSSELS